MKLLSTIKSVLAAFIGIQSNKNREDDFQQGKFSHFIIVALFILLFFIGGLIGVVNLVLP